MQTVCIKMGGSVIDTPGLPNMLGKNLRRILDNGNFPLVVHGGGKDIGRQLNRLNKEFAFIEGMRVTDAETMQTVQMVLSGDINKRIVSGLLGEGIQALGVSGVDGGLFEAEKLLFQDRDIGFVGSISSVNVSVVEMCRCSGMVPVISPVSRGRDGKTYNVNADLAAGELAIALQAEHLIFISDVAGVLVGKEVKHEIPISEVEGLINDGFITGGMIPKVRSAAEAVARGVSMVHICGNIETFADELTVETSHGTVIY